jgi:hypothetical protein
MPRIRQCCGWLPAIRSDYLPRVQLNFEGRICLGNLPSVLESYTLHRTRQIVQNCTDTLVSVRRNWCCDVAHRQNFALRGDV